MNTLIFNIDYVDPISIYIKQIHDVISKSQNILFIDDLRIIIHKMHLLDFKPEIIFNTYIEYIIKKNLLSEDKIHLVIQEAALNELNCNKTNKYFFCLEKFFIFIKSII